MTPRTHALARWTGLATLLGAVGCAVACALPALVLLAGGSLALPSEWLFFAIPFAAVLGFAAWRHHRACGCTPVLSLRPRSEQVACSLDGPRYEARVDAIGALVRSPSFLGSEFTDERLVWRFRWSRSTKGAVLALVRAEHRCCPFFGFEVHREGDALVLRIVGPAEARSLLEALHEQAQRRSAAATCAMLDP